MLEGNGVIEHEDKVRSNLDTRNINNNRITGVSRLTWPGIIVGYDTEPVHDPVQDVGQGAPWLEPLDSVVCNNDIEAMVLTSMKVISIQLFV